MVVRRIETEVIADVTGAVVDARLEVAHVGEAVSDPMLQHCEEEDIGDRIILHMGGIYSPEVRVAKLTRIQVDHGQVAVVADP